MIAKSVNEETKSKRRGRRFASAGYGNKKVKKKQQQKDNIMKTKCFLMLPHPLTNFEI